MREMGLAGAVRGRAWTATTQSERETPRPDDLVDRHFPDATTIRVVLDNLNTHTKAALYEAFAPAEARRLLRKLEFHFTPVCV